MYAVCKYVMTVCCQCDEFIIEAVTLKELRKVKIGHNSTKAGDGWFLDKVVVKPLNEPDKAVEFKCGRFVNTHGLSVTLSTLS